MTEPILTPLGEPDHDGTYQRYLDALQPCPICGRVDELDNAEGKPGMVCAACSLHDGDEEDDEQWFFELWGTP